MSFHRKQKTIWLTLGAAVGMTAALLVAFCCVPATGITVPVNACRDAGSNDATPTPTTIPRDAGCDGDAETDAALTVHAVDPGPSCGSHPWCTHPKECCTDVFDCCD